MVAVRRDACLKCSFKPKPLTEVGSAGIGEGPLDLVSAVVDGFSKNMLNLATGISRWD